jgi:3-oxoacyl-[acyl-carrier-protein] synthase II
MSLALTGWGLVCSAGIGPAAFRSALVAPQPAPDVTAAYAEPLPAATAHVLRDFDVRALLGRKGTGALDRRTALALVACRQALADGALTVTDENRQRIGVVLGTTWGSLEAMSHYTRDSLLEERPYLVEPARFPNTVMNCAAGQAAIWHGLKGVNATIAGGTLAFLNVLDYVANLLRCGHADTLLAGAVEEFTPHAAWAHHLTQPATPSVPAGEAAIVFVVERAAEARAAGRRLHAEVLAVATGFAPESAHGRRAEGALSACIRRVLAAAAVTPADIARVQPSGHDDARAPIERAALADVFGPDAVVERAPKTVFGECQAATGALQVAALIARAEDGPAHTGWLGLVTGYTEDGALGAALLKVHARDGADRG